MQSGCIFCGSSLAGNRAKEHILPTWLLQEFGWSRDFVMPTHFSDTGEVLSSRSHDMSSFVEGNVCPSCNNGWMSALEGRAKSLIVDLARGKREVIQLPDGEALLLVAWTAKTCICLYSASNYRRIIPSSHFQPLDADKFSLPQNVFVVGHTFHSSTGFSWVQSPSLEVIQPKRALSEEEFSRLKISGYKISLRIGCLYLLLGYIPFPFGKPALYKYRHVPLYPRRSCPVVWQISADDWPDEPTQRLFAFHTFFGFSTGDV
jgi:hypothetical protein